MSDKVLVERELLEGLACIAEIEGQPEGEKARALLSAQPQSSAAQSAPVVPEGTPGAAWRANGEPDPHGDRYNCERAALSMGHLTDDELANGAFLNYDAPLNLEGILAGTHSAPIAWMTAVKDRIRWLSRQLAAAPQPAARYSTEDLQRQAMASGLQYVREPDDHYVTGTTEQAIQFIRDVIGVDARLTDAAAHDQGEVRGLREALELARDYVYCELEERKAAMAGYPHKWQQEEADLAAIDAALSASESQA